MYMYMYIYIYIYTESNNTLTSNQLGTKPCTQTHDAIYSLISTIHYNKYTLQKPDMWLLMTTPQPTPQCTETDCHLSSCTMTL